MNGGDQHFKLVRYDAMVAAIEEARTLEDVKEIHDRANALRAYKRIATDETALRQVSEIKVRAERRAGQLLAEMEDVPGPGRGNKRNASENIPFPTLKDLGVSPHQSSDWQRIATIPEPTFEELLRDAVEPVTTKMLVAAAPPTERQKAAAVPKQKAAAVVRRPTKQHLTDLLAELRNFVPECNNAVKLVIQKREEIEAFGLSLSDEQRLCSELSETLGRFLDRAE